jgi:hypothetical protein
MAKTDAQILAGQKRQEAFLRLAYRALAEITVINRDISTLTAEALKASRESAERTAEILGEIRKH